jgi:uncharacterized protein YndB with AHSA1/START domain
LIFTERKSPGENHLAKITRRKPPGENLLAMSTPKSTFVYVIYIRTTPEKLWQALTQPEFTRQFFMGTVQESEWQVGAAWKMVAPDGRVGDSGEVLEIDPPRRLVLKWQCHMKPEHAAEGYSRMTYTLEPQGEMVKLTVLQEMDREGSTLIQAVGQGWPLILSSLKSLLETGAALALTPTGQD